MLEIDIRRAITVPGIYACFLKFSTYNENWVAVIRSFNCRKYYAETREWEFPFYNLGDIISRYPNLEIKIHFKKEKLENDILEVPKLDLKKELFNHQKIAVEYGINHPKYLLLDTMGLGKTASIIAEAIALKKLGKIRQCLIICCVSDLQYNWEEEIKKFSDESCYILGSRYRKNGKRYAGSINERIEDLKTHKEFFLITNAETLQKDKFVDTVNNEFKKTPTTIDFLAIDECHKKTGNPDNLMGKNLMKLSGIPYIVPMTGTLIRNRPTDAWVPLTLIGKEHSTYSQFKHYYCEFGEYNEVTSYRNLDALQMQLSQCSLRRVKEDVLDLPPKLYENVYVTMNERQQMIYDEVYNQLLENIDRIEESPNPLAMLIRLRQATGFTGILSTSILESAKMDRIEEDVDEIVENNKKVIIYSNWTEMTDELQRRLEKKYKVLSVAGNTVKSGDQVEEIKRKFQQDPEYKIIIGTTGKLGTGHTLTAADYILFLDEPWTMADKDQATDRAHRPGLTHCVNIRTYITKDTIDEKVNEIVEEKGAVADFIVDGKSKDNRKLARFLLNLE